VSGCLLLATSLAACDANKPATMSASEVEALRPNDARLSQMYERACMGCHVDAASGAPRTGDHAAWAQRMGKGREVLIQNARQGLNAMPPMGLCPDCSTEDLAQLIDFMRSAGGAS
jgi:cytochrome c5